MSDRSRIVEVLEGIPLAKASDLRAAGIHPRAISKAVDDYEICQIARGLYTTLERASIQHINYAAIHLLTGGVVFGMTAAAIHGLSNASPPSEAQLLVPNEFHGKVAGLPVSLFRTRKKEILTEGVVDHEIAPGLSFKVTSPARTIIDLYRNPATQQHAHDGLSDYLDRDLPTADLHRLSKIFGVETEIDAHVTMAMHYRNRTTPRT